MTTNKLSTDGCGHQVDYHLSMGEGAHQMTIVADNGLITVTMDDEIVKECRVTDFIGEIATLFDNDEGKEILSIQSLKGSELLIGRSGRRSEYAYLEYGPSTGETCADRLRLGTWFCHLLGIDD